MSTSPHLWINGTYRHPDGNVIHLSQIEHDGPETCTQCGDADADCPCACCDHGDACCIACCVKYGPCTSCTQDVA